MSEAEYGQYIPGIEYAERLVSTLREPATAVQDGHGHPATLNPEPASHGPPLADRPPDEEILRALMDERTRLLAEIYRAKQERKLRVPFSANTDSSGNATTKLYDVPQGFEFDLRRFVCEAQGYTPASPYSGASAWIGLARGVYDSPTFLTPPVGALLDFAPTQSGGQVFPQLSTDSYGSAALVFGGETVSLIISGGPASTRVSGYIQGTLRQS